MAEPIRTTDNGRPSQAGNRIANFGKDTRFKKGKPGNPAGRPKRPKSDQSFRQILMREFGGLRG